MNGYIKLHRQALEWEWYKDTPTKVIFFHLLLTANYEQKKWRGKVIQAGQLITSYNNLAHETNLSIKLVRNSIERLIQSGEIEIKTNNKFTLITILNWTKWQGNENIEPNEDEQPGAHRNASPDSIRTEMRANKGHAKGHTKGTQKGTQRARRNASPDSIRTEMRARKGHTKGHTKGTPEGNKQERKNLLRERDKSLSLPRTGARARTRVIERERENQNNSSYNSTNPATVDKEARKLFQSFCKRNNVRNINAYLRKIINNGDYQAIIDEEKERLNRLELRKKTEIEQTQTVENEVNLPPDFFQKVREQARKGEK